MPPRADDPSRKRRRRVFAALGYGAVALGAVGAFVPLLPTTVFLILAVGFFLRSEPRLARRLLRDRRSGPVLRQWLRHGAMSRRAKAAAVGGMASGFGLSALAFGGRLVPIALTFVCLAAAATFVVTRPAPPRSPLPAHRGR